MEAAGTSTFDSLKGLIFPFIYVPSDSIQLSSFPVNLLLSWFYFTFDYSSRAHSASSDSLRVSSLLGLTRSETHQPILPWAAETVSLRTSKGQPRVDIEKQRCIWWLAYATDRWQNANTSWPALLDDADVTQVLPLPLDHMPTVSAH